MEKKILELASHRLKQLAWTLTNPFTPTYFIPDIFICDSLFHIFTRYGNNSGKIIHKNTNTYKEISSFISECEYYCVLSQSFEKHNIRDIGSTEQILHPLIILYERQLIVENSEESFENDILKFKSENYIYQSKFILGGMGFKEGENIFDPLMIKSHNKLESLGKVSFFKLSIHFSKNITAPFNEKVIILTEDNRFIMINAEQLFDSQYTNILGRNSFSLKEATLFNNSIIVNGEGYGRSYLSESHHAFSIWLDLNNFSILYLKQSNSNYNGK